MEVTKHAPGTPSWADVTTTDIDAAVAFYTGLFGWNAIDQGEEAGHYHMFEIGGKAVAAGQPKQEGDPGPPRWSTYITVADADETAAAIEANGGTILMPPFDVFDSGRMTFAMDPSGGAFAAWQPINSIGSEIVNEPNTMCWNELTVRNADEVLPFYSAVFGWTVNKIEGPMVYRELQLDGRSIGGCIEMDDSWPDMPTHWMVYFAVDDCDAAAERAKELGGTVHVGPTDIRPGRFSVLADPTGAVFTVLKLNEG